MGLSCQMSIAKISYSYWELHSIAHPDISCLSGGQVEII
jgi:hypothetical protein